MRKLVVLVAMLLTGSLSLGACAYSSSVKPFANLSS